MSLPKLNLVEPPWYGPVCPVVGEGWHREVSPYPDLLPHSGRPGQRGATRVAGAYTSEIEIETEKNATGRPVLTLRRERMELRPMRVPQQPLKSGLPVELGAACRFPAPFRRSPGRARPRSFYAPGWRL
jgi:hypothetical protein